MKLFESFVEDLLFEKKEELKSYNNLTDVEKHIIREYETWAKSDAPIPTKIKMLDQWRKRAIDKNIEHLLKKK